ncbi:hypothetical protein DF185_18715 [Marinifilum breve]|uniref:Uncharacterized protein n=1 Tax=Marinifilum breve TaxID=2184082 RepID=A0A2V3ZTP1_9BACT|nr:hypothetical protein DF185_18715 [Marinifilum breve]
MRNLQFILLLALLSSISERIIPHKHDIHAETGEVIEFWKNNTSQNEEKNTDELLHAVYYLNFKDNNQKLPFPHLEFTEAKNCNCSSVFYEFEILTHNNVILYESDRFLYLNNSLSPPSLI